MNRRQRIPDPQQPRARSRRSRPVRWAAADLKWAVAGAVFRSRDSGSTQGGFRVNRDAHQSRLQPRLGGTWVKSGMPLITIDVPRWHGAAACPNPICCRDQGHLFGDRRSQLGAHFRMSVPLG